MKTVQRYLVRAFNWKALRQGRCEIRRSVLRLLHLFIERISLFGTFKDGGVSEAKPENNDVTFCPRIYQEIWRNAVNNYCALQLYKTNCVVILFFSFFVKESFEFRVGGRVVLLILCTIAALLGVQQSDCQPVFIELCSFMFIDCAGFAVIVYR